MSQNEIQSHQNHPEYESILSKVYRGMDVFDSEGDRIGSVETIFLGSSHLEARGAATATTPNEPTDRLTKSFKEALNSGDQIPDALKDRLYYDGFIRVDNSKLLSRDRYVLADQVAAVEGDRVILNAPYRELAKTGR